MHILLVPSWYKTPTSPIRGSFFVDQALALQNAGHKVGMLVPPSTLRTYNGVSEVRRFWRRPPLDLFIDTDDGFPTYRVPWWGWWGALNPLARVDLMHKALQQYTEQYGAPDLLHGHAMIYGGYIAAELGKRENIPVVVTEHSSIHIDGIPVIHTGHQWIVKQTLQATEHVLAVSESLAQHLQRYDATRQFKVVGNMVDTVKFCPSEALLPRSPFVFTIIGRLVAPKGHAIVLQAFAEVSKHHNLLLNIVGDGVLHEHLQQQASDLGIGAQCHFWGIIDHKEIPDLLNKSHVLISASDKETFGVTIIESLACGKPVIATYSGGPEYILNDQTGILVPYGEVDALVQAMRQMIDSYNQYDPAVLHQYCVERYSQASVVHQLEKIYHKAIHDAKT